MEMVIRDGEDQLNHSMQELKVSTTFDGVHARQSFQTTEENTSFAKIKDKSKGISRKRAAIRST